MIQLYKFSEELFLGNKIEKGYLFKLIISVEKSVCTRYIEMKLIFIEKITIFINLLVLPGFYIFTT